MQRSAVNDSAREDMGAIARWYGDVNGSLLTTGTGAAYVIASTGNAGGNPHAALTDQSMFLIQFHVANDLNPTLKVDGLAAKPLRAADGSNLNANTVDTEFLGLVAYNRPKDLYVILGLYSVVNGAVTFNGPVAIGPNDTLTIAAGAITPTGSSHRVDTEAAAAADDLSSIVTTGLVDGTLLTLRSVDAARVVTVKNGSGADLIATADGQDYDLGVEKSITLRLSNGQWYESSRSAALGKFTSTQQTITLNSILAVPHGLGVDPFGVEVAIECVTTEHNWAVGDIIRFGPSLNTQGTNDGMYTFTDATNVNVQTGINVFILNKTTFQDAAITPANWRYIVKAWV